MVGQAPQGICVGVGLVGFIRVDILARTVRILVVAITTTASQLPHAVWTRWRQPQSVAVVEACKRFRGEPRDDVRDFLAHG